MAKYDVYADPNGQGYLLEVQADLLDALNTRVVVPLIPVARAPKPAKRLNPVFEIENQAHVMTSQFLAAVPRTLLLAPVANLSANFAEITDALDMLFQGF